MANNGVLYKSTPFFVLDEARQGDGYDGYHGYQPRPFSRIGRYSSAVHGYQRKVTAWTRLDLI